MRNIIIAAILAIALLTTQAGCGASGTPAAEPTNQPEQTVSVSAPAPAEHAHVFTSRVVREATCAEEGLKLYTCSTCGDVYAEAINKTDSHDWAARPNGGETYCTVCGAAQ